MWSSSLFYKLKKEKRKKEKKNKFVDVGTELRERQISCTSCGLACGGRVRFLLVHTNPLSRRPSPVLLQSFSDSSSSEREGERRREYCITSTGHHGNGLPKDLLARTYTTTSKRNINRWRNNTHLLLLLLLSCTHSGRTEFSVQRPSFFFIFFLFLAMGRALLLVLHHRVVLLSLLLLFTLGLFSNTILYSCVLCAVNLFKQISHHEPPLGGCAFLLFLILLLLLLLKLSSHVASRRPS